MSGILCWLKLFFLVVSNYSLNGEVQAREFAAPAVKENGHIDNHKFVEQKLQQVPESKTILEENTADVNSMHQNASTVFQDHLPVSVEEHAEEPQKHTYASIVCFDINNQSTIDIVYSFDQYA